MYIECVFEKKKNETQCSKNIVNDLMCVSKNYFLNENLILYVGSKMKWDFKRYNNKKKKLGRQFGIECPVGRQVNKN